MNVGKPSGVKKATELQQSLSFRKGIEIVVTPAMMLATMLELF
jgi:hypothetical protein